MNKTIPFFFLSFLIANTLNAQTAEQKISEQPTTPKEFHSSPKLSSKIPQIPAGKEPAGLTKGKPPEKTVELFIALDLSGDRVKKGGTSIKKLTNWAELLKWDLYVVVEEWGIQEVKKKGNKGVATIQFEIAGRVVNDQFFFRERGTEILEIPVIYDKKTGTWKIENPQFAPHIHISALPEGLQEITIQKSDRPRKEEEPLASVHD
ncbi:hypothetical protein ACFLRA_02685 [Bdellovibrionota bacterium]